MNAVMGYLNVLMNHIQFIIKISSFFNLEMIEQKAIQWNLDLFVNLIKSKRNSKDMFFSLKIIIFFNQRINDFNIECIEVIISFFPFLLINFFLLIQYSNKFILNILLMFIKRSFRVTLQTFFLKKIGNKKYNQN